MKILNFTIVALMLCVFPSVGGASIYVNNYGSHRSHHRTHEYVRPAIVEQEYVTQQEYVSPTTVEQEYVAPQRYENQKQSKSVNFFVGLNASIVEYSHIKVSTSGYSEEHTTTKINNTILENAGLSLGLETQSGFRISLLFTHKDTEDIVNTTESETSQTNVGLALDIPFVKAKKTSPFIRLGLEHTSASSSNPDMDASGFGYFAGLGVTHNFTKNLFGVVSATYEIGKPDVKVSGVDVSYKQNLFGLGVGLGYRF